jgi:DNA polymerase III gamma/tau subunit
MLTIRHQICKVLYKVAAKEGIQLPETFALKLAEKSDGNLRKALLMFEAARVKQLV